MGNRASFSQQLQTGPIRHFAISSNRINTTNQQTKRHRWQIIKGLVLNKNNNSQIVKKRHALAKLLCPHLLGNPKNGQNYKDLLIPQGPPKSANDTYTKANSGITDELPKPNQKSGDKSLGNKGPTGIPSNQPDPNLNNISPENGSITQATPQANPNCAKYQCN